MEIKVTKLPQSQVKIEITVPAIQMADFKKKAIQQLGENVEVSGFRKGKAPQDLVEKQLNPNQINEKVLQLAVSESYGQALAQENLSPISDPEIKVKKFIPENELEYEALIYTWPETKLGDWKAIKIEKTKPTIIKDAEIEYVLKNLQKQKAEIKTVKRSAKQGDKVEVDFMGKVGGKTLPELESKNHPLILGENVFIPGFEENLLGLKGGEKKEFSLVFPKEHPKKDLAGKKADFVVEIKTVQEIKLPELNDNFAKSVGVENFEKLKKEIKKKLEEQKNQEKAIEEERQILEKLREKSQMEIPEILVEKNLEKRLESIKENVSKIGLTLEKYCQSLKITPDKFKEELRKEIKNELENLFILFEISKQEQIKLTPEELKPYEKQVQKEQMADLAQNLLLKKALDFIREKIIGKRS